MLVRRPLLRRDQGRARPRGRDRRRRRAALRAEPADVALPRARRGGSRPVPRAARRGGHRRRARARALPLQPRDAGRDGLRQERRDDALDRRHGLRDRGGRRRLPRRLAPRRRARGGRRSARVPALREVLERCSETTWLLLENSAGAGGTIGRSLDELASARRRARRPSAARHLPRLLPPVRLGRRRRRARTPSRRSLAEVDDADRPRPAARAARQRRRRAARLEPRPARERARGRARRAARRLPRAPGPAGACRR